MKTNCKKVMFVLILCVCGISLLQCGSSGNDCPSKCGDGRQCCAECPCTSGQCTQEGKCESNTCEEKVFTGDYEITPEKNKIEDLLGYTSITGNLHLSNIENTTLDSLECLQHVGGNFNIGWLEKLESVAALKNLTTVDGAFGIYHCYSLTNLEGLENLTTVGDYLDISFNSKLPLCEVEKLVQRLRDNGFTGNAETSYNDEFAICD